MARSRCRIRFKGASMIDFDADSETEFEATATWVAVARRLSSLEPAQGLWMMRPSALEGARVDGTGLTLLISVLDARQRTLTRFIRIFTATIDLAEDSIIIM